MLITPKLISDIPDPQDWWKCLGLDREYRESIATALFSLHPDGVTPEEFASLPEFDPCDLVNTLMAILPGVDNGMSLLRHFACACAERVLDRDQQGGQEVPRAALEVAKRYADGTATTEELADAKHTVRHTCWGCVWSACYIYDPAAAWHSGNDAATHAAMLASAAHPIVMCGTWVTISGKDLAPEVIQAFNDERVWQAKYLAQQLEGS